MGKNILLIDVGSTFTKVTAVDVENKCVLGTARSFTTVETDINFGLNNAVEELKKKIGEITFEEKYACSSAAGGLKMVAIGLVPDLTAKAAKMAALSAGAKLQKTFSYELSEEERDEIYALKPDIVLLCGGTDGGNTECILHNAQMLASIPLNIPVVVAGNKSVSGKVAKMLEESGKDVRLTENVMPEFNVLNIDPAQKKIRDVFLERIVRAKGMTHVEGLIKGILMPTPSAVLKCAALLSKGTKHQAGVGDLMVVDIGGATTDVYSICDGRPLNPAVVLKGLPEPHDKRTVEGDLGARYSVHSVIEAFGFDEFCEKSGLTAEQVNHCLDAVTKDKSIIAADPVQKTFDNCVGGCCAALAARRHAGTIEKTFGMCGEIYVQTGKDLKRVSHVIGTGGPIIDASEPLKILKEVSTPVPGVLLPKDPKFAVDKKYILAAMGILSEYYPDVALEILNKELEWN